MAGLTTEKTWNRTDVAGTTSSSYSLKHRSLMLAIKNALIAGTGAWSVIGSCDGSSYGMDAVDRWADYQDIAFGSNIGWIILRQTGMGSSFAELMIAATDDTSGYNLMYFKYSEDVAFSGGDLTTMPSAAGAGTLCSDAPNWMGSSVAGTGTYKASVYKTSDGSCTRVVVGYAASEIKSFWMLDTLKNPASWLDKNCAVVIAGGFGKYPPGRSTFYGNNPQDDIWVHAATPGWMDCGISLPGGNLFNTTFGPICDETLYQSAGVDSRFVVCPCSVISNDPVARGYIGEMYDFYAIPSSFSDGQSLLDGNGNDHYFHAVRDWAIGDDGTSVNYY